MLETIVSIALLISNIIITLTGLVLAIFGGLFSWQKDTILEAIGGTLSEKYDDPEYGELGLSLNDMEVVFGHFITQLFELGIGVFLFGFFLTIIGIIGLRGTWIQSRPYLIAYCVGLSIIIIGLLLLFNYLMFEKDSLKKQSAEFFKKHIKDHYVGLPIILERGDGVSDRSFKLTKPSLAKSVILDLLMAVFGCCGIHNSSDFTEGKAPLWKRRYNDSRGSFLLKIPISCCKMDEDSGLIVKNKECLRKPDKRNSNMKIGCFRLLWVAVDKVVKKVLFVLGGSIIFSIILVAYAIYIVAISPESARLSSSAGENEAHHMRSNLASNLRTKSLERHSSVRHTTTDPDMVASRSYEQSHAQETRKSSQK